MIVVRPAADRFVSTGPGIQSWHCLSAGAHYDPAWLAFGPLLGIDEHLLQPGAGFAMHRHSGVEIITYVRRGRLLHRDSTGAVATLEPGEMGWQSAGPGLEHAEVNAVTAAADSDAPHGLAEPEGGEVDFIQLTLMADPAADVGHRVIQPADERAAVLSAQVVNADPRSATPVRADLRLVDLAAGHQWGWDLPGNSSGCLLVVDGEIDLGARTLGPMDTALISGPEPVAFEAARSAVALWWLFTPAN